MNDGEVKTAASDLCSARQRIFVLKKGNSDAAASLLDFAKLDAMVVEAEKLIVAAAFYAAAIGKAPAYVVHPISAAHRIALDVHAILDEAAMPAPFSVIKHRPNTGGAKHE